MNKVRKALKCQRKGEDALNHFLIMTDKDLQKLYNEINKAIIRGRDWIWFGFFSVYLYYDINELETLRDFVALRINERMEFCLRSAKKDIESVIPILDKWEKNEPLDKNEERKLYVLSKMAYESIRTYKFFS